MMLLSSFCLFLNFKAYRRAASIYILGLNCLLILFTSLLGGFSIQIHPLLIVMTFCSASILISIRYAIAFNVILFIGYIVARQYNLANGSILDTSYLPAREFINFGFVILSAFIISRLILKNVMMYVHNQQKALDDAKELIDEIKKQNSKLEMFNSIVAHDLITPTRQAIGFIDLSIRNNQDKELDPYLANASTAAYRMKELIQSVSNLNALSKEDEALAYVDLNELVPQLIESDISAYHDNVKISLAELPKLMIKKAHAQILVLNLLDNAVKYNLNDEKSIKITSTLSDAYLNISFIDNGIGIDQEYKDLLTKPFKRLHTYEEYPGTGLGLYIVSEILQLYKAQLSFSANENNKGSCFTISFPLEMVYTEN